MSSLNRILDVLKAAEVRKGDNVIKNRDPCSGILSTLNNKETWGMKICLREYSVSGAHKYPDICKRRSPVVWTLQEPLQTTPPDLLTHLPSDNVLTKQPMS